MANTPSAAAAVPAIHYFLCAVCKGQELRDGRWVPLERAEYAVKLPASSCRYCPPCAEQERRKAGYRRMGT